MKTQGFYLAFMVLMNHFNNFFFDNFSFRGTWAELQQKYPSTNFEILKINGKSPDYRRSYIPAGTRTVSLQTLKPHNGGFHDLSPYLQKYPDQFRVVSIGLPWRFFLPGATLFLRTSCGSFPTVYSPASFPCSSLTTSSTLDALDEW